MALGTVNTSPKPVDETKFLKTDQLGAANGAAQLDENKKLLTDQLPDIGAQTMAFTQASTRANLSSGEKLSVMLGKIAKWFADLGSLAFKSSVAKTDLDSSVQASLNKADSALQSFTETDPTVPAWAKASTKPSYTASEVGAEASGAVSTHNTNTSAHNDIRLLIEGLTTRLNALADSDDTTLDQMSEVVAYIKSNKSLIDAITTDKVNVTDIINNLTTNVSNKPLSAAQGVAIKALIDEVAANLSSHTGNTSNPHSVTKAQVGLGNVPNVATNDQTPTYSAASSLATLTSGEKLSVSMGKIMKAITDLISHIANKSNPHGVTVSQIGAAASSHYHAAGDITSGTLAVARGGTGATTAAAARTALGITPANIGAAASSHGNHVPTTETANNARFLRNDNTWQTVTPANIGAATSGHTHSYAGSSSAGGAANSANKLANKRTISLTGDVTGSGQFDGSGDLTISVSVKNGGVLYATYGSTTYSEIKAAFEAGKAVFLNGFTYNTIYTFNNIVPLFAMTSDAVGFQVEVFGTPASGSHTLYYFYISVNSSNEWSVSHYGYTLTVTDTIFG